MVLLRCLCENQLECLQVGIPPIFSHDYFYPFIILIHLVQYLAAVHAYGFILKLLRIDRGGETTVFAGAHYWLVLAALQAEAAAQGQEWPPAQPVPFSKACIYGMSIHNQRIESWWGQLLKGSERRWIVRNRSWSSLFTHDRIQSDLTLGFLQTFRKPRLLE